MIACSNPGVGQYIMVQYFDTRPTPQKVKQDFILLKWFFLGFHV